MKKLIVFTLLTVLVPVTVLFGQDYKQNSIAVVDFDNKGVEQNIPPTVTEIFNTEIFRAGKFNIIERNQVKRILEEQKFQVSGLSDNDFTKLGKILGAKFILVGSVGMLGKKYIINSRILDVESAAIVMAESGSTFTVEDIEGVSQNIARKMVIQLNQRLNPNEPKTPDTVQPQPQTQPEVTRAPGTYKHFISIEGSIAPLSGFYWSAGASYHYALSQNFFLGAILDMADFASTGNESYDMKFYRLMPSAILQLSFGVPYIQFGLAAGGFFSQNSYTLGGNNFGGTSVNAFGVCGVARAGLGLQLGSFFITLSGAFEGGMEFINSKSDLFGGPTGWLTVGFAL